MTYWPKIKNVKNPLMFIHIPKTAGISIQKWMKMKYRKLHERIHLPIDQIDNYENYFTFTVIRNPYDRAFSAYKYRGQVLENHKLLGIKDCFHELNDWHKGFAFWVKNYFHIPWKHFNKGGKPLTLYSPQGTGMLIVHLPQLDWITIQNKIVVNKILYFETLDEDIKSLNQYNNNPVPKKNKSLYQLKNSYKDYYDTKSKKIIERHYEKDLDTFKYSF